MDTEQPEVIKLRKSLLMSKRVFYDHLLEILLFGLSPQLDKECAPEKQRLGIFGPYDGGASEKRIDEIAKLVSSLGLGVVIGKGFYRMNDPNTFHSMEELFPGRGGVLAKQALEAFEVSDQDYFFHFPRLVVGAIIDLTIPRTQVYEAEGCEYYGIPRMGYIFYPQLKMGERICHYIINNDNLNIECSCPDYHLCDYQRLHKTVGLWCPFYSCVDIPFSVKKLFIREDSRLVATSQWPAGLEYLVRDFAMGNRTKNLSQNKSKS